MQADDDAVAFVQVVVHVFDLIGVHVGRGGFDGRRQVVNDFALRCRFPRVRYGITNLKGEVRFGGAKDFWGVLVQPLRLRVFGHAGHDALCAVDGDLLDLFTIHVEHDAAKTGCASVVQVNHGALGARSGLYGAFNEFGTRLSQRDDRDVVRDPLVVHKFADKIEVRL